MIRELLPPGTEVAEAYGDPPQARPIRLRSR